jgi:hypothetical protein
MECMKDLAMLGYGWRRSVFDKCMIYLFRISFHLMLVRANSEIGRQSDSCVEPCKFVLEVVVPRPSCQPTRYAMNA